MSKNLQAGLPDSAADEPRSAPTPPSFEELVRHESPRLFRVLVRFLRDEDEARSVMQETFLLAYQRFDTFRGEARLSTWLIGIGINLARATARKRRRYDLLEEQDIERLQPAFRMGMYAERYEPWRADRLAERAERKRLVHEAIDRLPEHYRITVVLCDMEELPRAEAARILGINEGTVRVRLHRARQALRALLDAYFQDEGS